MSDEYTVPDSPHPDLLVLGDIPKGEATMELMTCSHEMLRHYLTWYSAKVFKRKLLGMKHEVTGSILDEINLVMEQRGVTREIS